MKLSVFLLLLTLNMASTYENVALRGRATQSDRWGNPLGAAINAIDGNPNTVYSKGSCTHTNPTGTNPWWRVDLLKSYIVTSISVTNRQDCCHQRLDGLEIRVGKTLDNTKVGHIPSAGPGEKVTVNFTERVEGRYVTLALRGFERILTLCEVEVYGYPAPTDENLALQGKASQSSLHMFGFASNAIDGNKNTDWEMGSCSQTRKELNPWWRLDLRKKHKVFGVRVTNQDSNPERLDDAEILIGDSLEMEGNLNARCAVISGLLFGASGDYNCYGMEGRYINIVIPDREDSLTLCEVEVFGSPLE